MAYINGRNKVRVWHDLLNELDSRSSEKSAGEPLEAPTSINEHDHVFGAAYPRVVPGPPPHVKVNLILGGNVSGGIGSHDALGGANVLPEYGVGMFVIVLNECLVEPLRPLDGVSDLRPVLVHICRQINSRLS